MPVFQLQAGHPAELCGIGGDQRKTGSAGMTGQEHIVRADHTTLGFEKRANAPGFPRGFSVKNQLAKWSVSQITSRLACSFIYAAGAARKCGDARFSQFSMSCRVNFHANGFGVRLLNSSYNANRTRIASSFAKSFGVNTFLWMIEK